MKKIKILQSFFCVLFLLTSISYLYAECYNEEVCFKDFVKDQDKDQVLAVNRDTNVVELYWSDKDQTWLKPDTAEQERLQALYDKKLKLRRMQQGLDEMRKNSWYNTNQDWGAHR